MASGSKGSAGSSYVEGSIVARWYGYTPTSALDISINAVLPTTAVPA